MPYPSAGVEASSGVGADVVQPEEIGAPASSGAGGAVAAVPAFVAQVLPILLIVVDFGVVLLGVVAQEPGLPPPSPFPPSGGAVPLPWGEALRRSIIVDGASWVWKSFALGNPGAKRKTEVACLRGGGGGLGADGGGIGAGVGGQLGEG